MYSLDDSLLNVKGIGPKLFEQFQNKGFERVRDLLLHLPFRYEDRSVRYTIDQIKQLAHSPEKKLFTLQAFVKSARNSFLRGRSMQSATLVDETGTLSASWFNNPYIVKRLKKDNDYLFSGQVGVSKRGQVFLTQPVVEDIHKESIHTDRLVPVYSSIPGILPTTVRKLQKEMLDGLSVVSDQLSGVRCQVSGFSDLRSKNISNADESSILSLSKALQVIHFPDEIDHVIAARERFALEELVLLIEHSRELKAQWKLHKQTVTIANNDLTIPATIPFELTASQLRSAQEIITDLTIDEPMNRLLIGDVGSGKTIVAGLAMQKVVDAGYFAALIAPTQILAEQHTKTLHQFFPDVPIYLVTSKSKVELESPGFIVGTHAVLNVLKRFQVSGVRFQGVEKSKVKSLHQRRTSLGMEKSKPLNHLTTQQHNNSRSKNLSEVNQPTKQQSNRPTISLVVFDEQHRFGVAQRSELEHNGIHPHILTMTATPIPRSLMLTIFSHLSLSTIDELPKNRIPTKTWVLPESKRDDMYGWLREQITKAKGSRRQAIGVTQNSKFKAQNGSLQAASLPPSSLKLQLDHQSGFHSSDFGGQSKLQATRNLSVQSKIPVSKHHQKTLTPHSTLHNPQPTLHTPHSTFQVLIVCPFINPSESEALENVAAAKEMFEQVKSKLKIQNSKLDITISNRETKQPVKLFLPNGQKSWPGKPSNQATKQLPISIGLLHSKLKKTEKQQIITDLFSGKIDVLVTTPIVEVGVDLPQASAIVIEAAERFGLASLHQLRGRVGRAGQQGYCLLFSNSKSNDTKERLKKFESIHSGQKLAELDLTNRGAGDLFGTQQHGFDQLKFASWTDIELISKAKRIVDEFTKQKKSYTSPLLKPTNNHLVLAN